MKVLEAKKFYGQDVSILKANKRRKVVRNKLHVNCLNIMPDHIMGPSKFWAEFYRQAEALAVATERSNDNEMFCTFVYEQDNGTRKFVVAHPEVYWWYYKDRPPESRCSYEVIPAGAPCRLYMDIEFLLELNLESNGPRMISTFINILLAFMLKEFHLSCNKSNIINLDSTNKEKFSRHLILAVEDVAFKDNSHVGHFMKYICMEISNYLSNFETQHDILSTFDKSNIEELFINTKNGRKLFIDTGVYTRNRHFRIYKSTKWGKHSYLEVAPDCKYTLPKTCDEKELKFFINSLVAYFPKRKDLILLDFSNDEKQITKNYDKNQIQPTGIKYYNRSSHYPKVDTYIRSIIKPGRIRACRYNDWSKTLSYDIVGYRHCENIGRWHKSNNIFFIVDLNKKLIYQKCHDSECSTFISTPRKLPEEINFHLDLEDESFMSCAVLAEQVCQFCIDTFGHMTNVQ